MKIIDCFTFYNELELLTYRLNVLYDVVDYFIIVEATHTHTGKEKPLYFKEHQGLFDTFKDKIIHIIVDDFPHKFPQIDFAKEEQWVNERFQRNAIIRGFSAIPKMEDDDVIIITDLDEIPDPKTLESIKKGDISVTINCLEMDFYYYNLNNRFESKWRRSKIVRFKNFNELKSTCSDIRLNNYSNINHGGWHLSYFGDSRFIQNKLLAFAHQELNKECFTDISKIEERVKKGNDL